MRGKFITFEGGEGSGKSTQVAALAVSLRERGAPVLITREPGGTAFAEAVRAFLLFGPGRDAPGTALAEAMLFNAARADHVARVIGPALDAGTWVISDRFADSTRAYQGAAGGVSDIGLVALEKLATGGLTPDLTIILDVPARVGLARAETRRQGGTATAGDPERDLFEGRDVAFHERLREGFLALSRKEPNRFLVIDATPAVTVISTAIKAAIRHRLDLEAS